MIELRKVLRPAGAGANLLWRSVMPRVPEALARFQAMGKKLVIVSNSDGTVERSITEAGLRPFFDVVVDSAIVGFEKPDPRIFAHALEASAPRPNARCTSATSITPMSQGRAGLGCMWLCSTHTTTGRSTIASACPTCGRSPICWNRKETREG